MSSDKRQSLRKQSEYLIELYDPKSSFLTGVGRLLDLSATGALIETNLRLLLGQIMWTRLRRGARGHLELPITVTRVIHKGVRSTYGVKFNRS